MSDRHPSSRPGFEARGHYQDESVATDYDRARFHGASGSLVDRLERRLVLRALRAAGQVHSVLDLPTGSGRLATPLREAGYAVIGADVSHPMLLQARSRQQAEHRLIRADGAALPLRDKCVDAALCLRLLPHLPPVARRRLLGEMARVARIAVIAVYQPHKWSAWYVLRNNIQGRKMPRYYVSDGALQMEFAACGLRARTSLDLLRGVFMDRAYVLTPGAVDPPPPPR